MKRQEDGAATNEAPSAPKESHASASEIETQPDDVRNADGSNSSHL